MKRKTQNHLTDFGFLLLKLWLFLIRIATKLRDFTERRYFTEPNSDEVRRLRKVRGKLRLQLRSDTRVTSDFQL